MNKHAIECLESLLLSLMEATLLWTACQDRTTESRKDQMCQ
jgi:hypothetical protein